MAWVPYVVMAVSTVIQAQAEREKGKAEEAAADFEAAQLERAANARKASSQRQAMELKRQGELQQSRALSVAAASGASASDVGFSNLLSELAGESRYRQMAALYEGETGAQSMDEQAAITRWGGRRARRASNLAATSTVIKGASSMYSMYGGGGINGSANTGSANRVGYGGTYGSGYGFA